MERLTSRMTDGTAVMAWDQEEKHTTQEWIDLLTDRLAAYEDTGYTPEDFDALCREMHAAVGVTGAQRGLDRQQYQLAVADRIPQALVGGQGESRPQVVYFIEDGEIIEDYVCEVILCEDSSRQLAILYSTHEGIEFWQECIGKTVFLTEEDAKAALATEGGNGNG